MHKVIFKAYVFLKYFLNLTVVQMMAMRTKPNKISHLRWRGQNWIKIGIINHRQVGIDCGCISLQKPVKNGNGEEQISIYML